MELVRVVLLTSCLLAASASAQASSGPTLRRFAVVVGSNAGGPGRAQLRYAVSDAQRMAAVLVQLGGVAPSDLQLLAEPHRDDLLRALSMLDAQASLVKIPGIRTEVFLYYSGHSDAGGLLLGEERVTYSELRSALLGISGAVRIAILDSCFSGALTRQKGGTPAPAFLVDTSSRVSGHAFLTSSSASEAAQESDEIQGSFFTNALISGLRGAADLSRDGKVTLNEAYQFAFSETLARTEATHAGAQHPAYDMELVGTGEVVVTDVERTNSTLVLSSDLDGRVFIRDARDHLAAEIPKHAGFAVRVALREGAYQLLVQRGGEGFRASVNLQSGKTETVGPAQLRSVALVVNARRGPLPEPNLGVDAVPGHHHRVSAEVLGLLTTLQIKFEYEQALRPRLSFFLSPAFRPYSSDGTLVQDFVATGGLRFYLFDAAIRGAFLDAQVGVLTRTFDEERVRLGALASAGAGYTFLIQKAAVLTVGVSVQVESTFPRSGPTLAVRPVFRFQGGFDFL